MAAWKGALDLAGVRIHVRLHPRVKATRDPSFKILAPNGQPPVSQPKLDTDGNEVHETCRGVEVSKGEYVILTDEQLKQIKASGKTEVAEPDSFCPLESIDLAVNVMSYSVDADSNVAGAEGPVTDLWNWLRATRMAYVTQLVMKGGGKDSVLAIYATETELRAIAIPFPEQSYSAPEAQFEEDEERGKTIGSLIEQKYGDKIREFDPHAYSSKWLERREEQIEAAISGKPAPKPAEVPTAPKADDLVAALEGAIKDSGKKEPAAKKKAAKKKKVAA